MTSVEVVRAKHRERNVRWGFGWALWCAVLWGAWYIPGSAFYYEEPFVALSETTGGFLKAAAVITALNAVAVLLAMFLWTSVLGKTRDYGRTIRRRNTSKWFFLAAIFGGPMAIYGSFLAIGYVGAQFGAVAALLYPVVGAFLARLWLKETITARAALGIVIIVVGGVFIFTPGLLDEIGNPTGTGAWLGYLGGVMAMFGWGIEGVIAGKALDVTDPDVGLTIRFTAESLYWVLLILPVSVIFLGWELFTIAGDAIANPINLVWLALAGLTFGFCYVSWYKSFPLIGVGRGQAIAALYGPFALLFLWAFTFAAPSWQFVVGGIICVIGSFVLFTEPRGVLEVIRSLPGGKVTAATAGNSGDTIVDPPLVGRER